MELTQMFMKHFKYLVTLFAFFLLAACMPVHKFQTNMGFETGTLTDKSIQIKTRTESWQHQGQGTTIYAGPGLITTLPGAETKISSGEHENSYLNLALALKSVLQSQNITSNNVEVLIDYNAEFKKDAIKIDIILNEVQTSFEGGARIKATIITTDSNGNEQKNTYDESVFSLLISSACATCGSTDVVERKINRKYLKDLSEWLE